MKILFSVILVGLSTSVASAAEDCPLRGLWKSDAARTLADIVGKEADSAQAMNAYSDDVFGHMIHEWTCTDLRAWFDYAERSEPMPYEIRESDAASILVTFPEGTEHDIRIVFEGSCYKIQFGGRRYFEYFCPVEQ